MQQQSLRSLLVLFFLVLTVCASASRAFADDSQASAPSYSAHKLVPDLGNDVPVMSDLGERIGRGFLYCVGGLLLGLSLYKRWTMRKDQPLAGTIDVLSRRGLGPKTALLVVRAEGRKFFLAQTDGDVKLLSIIEPIDSFGDAFDSIDETPQTSSQQAMQAIAAAR